MEYELDSSYSGVNSKDMLRLSATIQLGKDPERDITVIPLGVIKKIRRLK